MKRRSLVLGGVAAIAVAPCARVFAHHGWSSFDETAPLYFEGKVKSVKWQNPHVELVVTLDGKVALPGDLAKREVPKQAASVDGAKIFANAKLPKRRGDWNVELAPLPRMDAWKVEPLKVGDTLRGIGFTYKDEQGAQVTRIEYLIVGNKTYGCVPRPRDAIAAARANGNTYNSCMLAFRSVSLKSRNTFGIEATAKQFADVTSEQALREWCATRQDKTQPLIIGGGSNLLITREVIDEPVLHVAPRGIRILEDTGDSVLVEAMAGEPWHAFVLWTIEQGFCGLENLSLIPGYVGAAPVQNIGAYGVEIRETCEHVLAIDTRDGSSCEFSNDECKFDYRDSVFKRVDDQHPRDRLVITRVRFRLARRFMPRLSYGEITDELATMKIDSSQLTARDVSNAVIAIRSRKLPDPAVIGNAGSFFKNPIVPRKQAEEIASNFPDIRLYKVGDSAKIAAGWLIDKTGWKGMKIGASGVHANHALVLVNHGGATGAELRALAHAIRADVRATFGIELEPEPRIV